VKTAVIIAAGGRGARFGGELSKQFVSIEGKPILTHVISRFESCDLVDGIYLVVPKETVQFCLEKCVAPFQFQKIVKIVNGGEERSDSVYNCLQALDDDIDLVLIHDGVRIFVTRKMIEDSIKSAMKHGAAICAIPLTDTIKSISKDLFVKDTHERKDIFCVQTPQAFKASLIKEAYRKAGPSRKELTDDSSFVERFSRNKVKVVNGSTFNIKITSLDDLYTARLFLRAGY